MGLVQDHVTVVYDAKDVDNVWDDVEAALARLPGGLFTKVRPCNHT